MVTRKGFNRLQSFISDRRDPPMTFERTTKQSHQERKSYPITQSSFLLTGRQKKPRPPTTARLIQEHELSHFFLPPTGPQRCAKKIVARGLETKAIILSSEASFSNIGMKSPMPLAKRTMKSASWGHESATALIEPRPMGTKVTESSNAIAGRRKCARVFIYGTLAVRGRATSPASKVANAGG